MSQVDKMKSQGKTLFSCVYSFSSGDFFIPCKCSFSCMKCMFSSFFRIKNFFFQGKILFRKNLFIKDKKK